MAYECMFGRRPYLGKSRKEIRDHILSKQVQIKRQDIPDGWSVEAADFINKVRLLLHYYLNVLDDTKKTSKSTWFYWRRSRRQESPLAERLSVAALKRKKT